MDNDMAMQHVTEQGILMKRWFRDVKGDLRRMRTGKWKEKAQERNTWLLIVKKAKDL